MSDDFVPTYLETDEGRLHLQEYLIQHRAGPRLRAIVFEGIENAKPAPGTVAAPGVVEALDDADGIVICPSNPLISIGPILAVPGIRDALRRRRKCVVAVCPLVGGKSLKGPSDKMMEELGYEVSAPGVARIYQDICARMVIDHQDSAAVTQLEGLGIEAILSDIVMRNLADKERLAREVLALLAMRA